MGAAANTSGSHPNLPDAFPLCDDAGAPSLSTAALRTARSARRVGSSTADNPTNTAPSAKRPPSPCATSITKRGLATPSSAGHRHQMGTAVGDQLHQRRHLIATAD